MQLMQLQPLTKTPAPPTWPPSPHLVLPLRRQRDGRTRLAAGGTDGSMVLLVDVHITAKPLTCHLVLLMDQVLGVLPHGSHLLRAKRGLHA
jgi:hypothetical protein